MKYSIESLMSLTDSDKISISLSNDIQVILDTINDWPDPVESVDIFVELLSKSVGNRLTQINIEKYILGLDPKIDAWKKEALTQLMFLFPHHHSGVTLDEIFFEIQKELSAFYESTKPGH
ncbi:hypothetical protein FAZ15_05595 [Sphingobacterium olei]|uniref:Uncharacterized protein n=1 Tax=Sphingobacterium olei TaxID=2571155 RepID=A0A4U0P3P7_9SPHI|nr:hypothetical protein [Sphingobacterium olei]TJZ61986.1 hypothetical protein FAZ15_05595 [Sphingobacterium olei]